MQIDWGKIGAIATIISAIIAIIGIIVTIILARKNKSTEERRSTQRIGGIFLRNSKIKQENTSNKDKTSQDVSTLFGEELDIEQLEGVNERK